MTPGASWNPSPAPLPPPSASKTPTATGANFSSKRRYSGFKDKIPGVLTKTGYAGIKGVGNALTAPTNRNGLRTAMQKLGGKPFEGAQAHHGLLWKFKDWFAKRGLNVNGTKFGAWVKGGGNGGHQSWSKSYDSAWSNFINKNPNASAKQVESFYNKMRSNKQWGGGF